MNSHPRVAINAETLLGAIVTWRAFHRDAPELQAWGEAPENAVVNLAGKLHLSLEYAADRFHRGLIEQPLADVQAVLSSIY